jgi:hypothetical protein
MKNLKGKICTIPYRTCFGNYWGTFNYMDPIFPTNSRPFITTHMLLASLYRYGRIEKGTK